MTDSTGIGAVETLGTSSYVSPVVQTPIASNQLLPNATHILVAGGLGPVTLVSTPSITKGDDGQFIILEGSDDANTLTFQSIKILAGSGVYLGSTNRTLGKGDMLTLMYNASATNWYEVAWTKILK